MTAATATERRVPGPIELPGQTALISRLRRAEGQVRGIERMVREQRPLLEIVRQVAAVDHALQAVALAMIDEEVERLAELAGRSADPELLTHKSTDLAAAMHGLLRTR